MAVSLPSSIRCDDCAQLSGQQSFSLMGTIDRSLGEPGFDANQWKMNDLDEIFSRLSTSSFRSSFRLQQPELSYFRRKGIETIRSHATQFIEQRLSAAFPEKDGKQTPYRNHPVFVAQHATGTCCRSCLQKWHSIPKGKVLNGAEKQYIVAVLERWLLKEDRAADKACEDHDRASRESSNPA